MPRLSLTSALVTVSVSLGMSAVFAQTPAKPTSPGEIAAASRLMAEKNADCRAQAKEQKLGFLKRRSFIRDCMQATK
jgi:hypothetical protein